MEPRVVWMNREQTVRIVFIPDEPDEPVAVETASCNNMGTLYWSEVTEEGLVRWAMMAAIRVLYDQQTDPAVSGN